MITVLGAISVSVQSMPGRRWFGLNPAIMLIVAAAILTAGAQLVSKHALAGLDIWTFYPYFFMGMSMPFLALLNPSTLQEIRRCLSRSSVAILMVAEAVLGSLAAWVTLAAIQSGPVSLVSAITGTRPIFVFLIGTILSLGWWKLLDEPIQRSILMQKAVSILLIVAGVAIISAESAT